MKINLYTQYFATTKANREKRETQTCPILMKQPLSADVVSFSGYSMNSIKKITGHCSYCGGDIFNENQFKELISTILSSSNENAQKHIDDIIETLALSKKSTNLAKDRRKANKDSVEFFKHIKDALKKQPSNTPGEVIGHFVGNKSKVEDILRYKLSPLKATVDHVEPQRLKLSNKDDEINLVEACQTCNGELKNGLSFSNFYSIYPSVKEHMPADKLELAQNGAINLKFKKPDSLEKLENVVTSLKDLEAKKQELINSDSIDSHNLLNEANIKISKKTKIKEDVSSEIEKHINDKKSELKELKDQLAALKANTQFRKLSEYHDISEELIQLQNGRQDLLGFLNKNIEYFNSLLNDKSKTQMTQKGQPAGANTQKLGEKLSSMTTVIKRMEQTQKQLEQKIAQKSKQQATLRQQVILPTDLHPRIAELGNKINNRQDFETRISKIKNNQTRKEELLQESNQCKEKAEFLKSKIIDEKNVVKNHDSYSTLRQARTVLTGTISEFESKKKALQRMSKATDNQTNSTISSMEKLFNDMKNMLNQEIDTTDINIESLVANEKTYQNNNNLKSEISKLNKKAEDSQIKSQNISINENLLNNLETELAKLNADEPIQNLKTEYYATQVKLEKLNSQMRLLDLSEQIKNTRSEIIMLERDYKNLMD